MIRWLADAPAPGSRVRWLGTKPNALGVLVPQDEHCWLDVSGLDATVDSGSGLFNAAAILANAKAAKIRCRDARGVNFSPVPGSGNTDFNCCCPENAVIDPNTNTCACVGGTVWDDASGTCQPAIDIHAPPPTCEPHYYLAVVGTGVSQHYECLKDPSDSYWWPTCPDGYFYDPQSMLCVDAGGTVTPKPPIQPSPKVINTKPCNPCTNVAGCAFVQMGSSNKNAVIQWQNILIRDAAISGAVFNTADGNFGTNTHRATKAWQTAKGLKADGIVGQTTWKASCPGSFGVNVEEATGKKTSGSSSDSGGIVLVGLAVAALAVIALASGGGK